MNLDHKRQLHFTERLGQREDFNSAMPNIYDWTMPLPMLRYNRF
jgi:hypothetical protein